MKLRDAAATTSNNKQHPPSHTFVYTRTLRAQEVALEGAGVRGVSRKATICENRGEERTATQKIGGKR